MHPSRALLRLLAIVALLAPLAAAAQGKAESEAQPLDTSVCLGCHGNEGFEAPGPDGKTRSLYVPGDPFLKSVHGQFGCTLCHSDITQVPHDLKQRAKVDCGSCHADEKAQYLTSVHGIESVIKHNPHAATCTSCHTMHAVASPKLAATRIQIVHRCGNCHRENFSSYIDTYHGQVNTLGYAYTAKCFDCHGSHGIQRVSDPASTVYPANRLATCRKCHANATAGFVTFEPHANTHDLRRYPYTWLASKLMIALLVGVFLFFWTHSLLWFYREYRDRRAGKSRTHVAAAAVPAGGRHIRRFGPWWRLAHLVFALSVMMLVFTGMTLFYADTAWARAVMAAFGGPRIEGIVHRTSAAVMLGIFFVHLVYLAAHLWRTRSTFRWFGPDSLVPNWKDFEDMLAMFKWFFGAGPRPLLERWTYWEKFDYWAVFWGMAIIGGSGMMLAFPAVTASFLPGWTLNVATLVHGEEAFLAAVFLFTVHFFNNHFRPDKLPPPDIVMFTGSVSLEEFSREHPLQYRRLAESGQLERYLVEVPSAPMRVGSKILGIVLILCGLALLALVAIGFHGTLAAGG